jgi:phasin family protein
MLNDKIVQNLTSNVEVAFATAQAMATAKSLSEIAKLQMDFIQKLATQATEQTKEFVDLSARATQHVFEKITKSFKSTSSRQFLRVNSQPETARGSSRSSLLLSRPTALRYGGKAARLCQRRFVSSGSVASLRPRLLSAIAD